MLLATIPPHLGWHQEVARPMIQQLLVGPDVQRVGPQVELKAAGGVQLQHVARHLRACV